MQIKRDKSQVTIIMHHRSLTLIQEAMNLAIEAQADAVRENISRAEMIELEHVQLHNDFIRTRAQLHGADLSSTDLE